MEPKLKNDKKLGKQDDDEERITNDLVDSEQCIDVKFDDWENIDGKQFEKKKMFDDDDICLSSDYNEIKIEERQEEALLQTLNYIGNGQFHFNNFHDSIINDSIPKFVIFFFNIKSIQNVEINSTKETEIVQNLTKKEIENIKYVIDFLSTKEIAFKILKFDFENSSTEENSAVLFYSNFLNYFYVKNFKKDIYIRCANILCTKKLFNNYSNQYELVKPSTFAALLHFYSRKNIKFDYNSLPKKVTEIEKYFKSAHIPMIINNSILGIGFGDQIADAVLYQYQMIFDAIDSGPKSLVVFEIILSVIHKLLKIEVPKYDKIAETILAKRASVEFQSNRSGKYINKLSKSSISENSSNEIESMPSQFILDTFKARHQELIKKDSINENQSKSAFKKVNSFEHFWNSIELNFNYDSGVFFQSTIKENKQKWENELANLLKSLQKKRKRSKVVSQINLQSHVSFRNINKSFVSKLYKIFCYDEDNKTWVFQNDVFKKFSNDKQINIDESKTPIVLLMNSFEKDSISLVENLINGTYPQLESEQDIFVYSFCDKPLSMLNYYIDFENKEKSSIKPMFLILHIPKGKEKLANIQQIIFDIYLFLTFISDMKIVILNKKYYVDQIKSIKLFDNILKSFKIIEQKSNDNDELIDIDNYSNEEQEEDDEEFEDENWEDDKKIDNDKSVIKLHLKDPKTLFLINNETNSFSSLENNLKENEFFVNLISQIVSEIHFINVSDPDSYEIFLQSLNDILITKKSQFFEVKNNFNLISVRFIF